MSTIANEPITPLQDKGFPSHVSVLADGVCAGLTKREYFAAMAMQGILARSSDTNENIATVSVNAADALITALNKQP